MSLVSLVSMTLGDSMQPACRNRLVRLGSGSRRTPTSAPRGFRFETVAPCGVRGNGRICILRAQQGRAPRSPSKGDVFDCRLNRPRLYLRALPSYKLGQSKAPRSIEEVLQPVHEARRGRGDFRPALGGELLEQFALPRVQLARHFDKNARVEVPTHLFQLFFG